jgi:hypothetical protein
LGDRGRRRARGGRGIGVILLGHGLIGGQRLVAVGLDLGGFCAGLCAHQIGGGLIGGGAIDAGVDLIQGWP